ncbi:MAG: hypothetical protein QOK17_2504 [Sphingomonadales bacterium]|jgi:hypothetical protein|nr:hypothetical protein [Sphingomonadales bacterium]
MRAKAIACLLLVAAAPAHHRAAPGPAGHYRLAGGPDVASEILLRPDGRFQFFLMEGALDEQAQGRWTAQGSRIKLVTLPKPVPPVFSAGPATRTAETPLKLRVTWPDGRGIATIDLRVGFDSGDPVESYTQEDGWSLDPAEKRVPRWVELGLQMYGIGYIRFPIDLSRGNSLTFVLIPNGLGTMEFDDVEVEAEPGALIFRRAGQQGRYVRQPR